MTYLHSEADISEDGIYRYSLSRRLSMGERAILFVGLNPSTADGLKDDPTIRKCAGFARQWGFDWLFMGNLHAYRSTDPKALYRGIEPTTTIGPRNLDALTWMHQKAEVVVAAWGQNKLNRHAKAYANVVLGWSNCHALGFNADGTPRHPLYLPYSTPLVPVLPGAD